jgi:hypothetical protein
MGPLLICKIVLISAYNPPSLIALEPVLLAKRVYIDVGVRHSSRPHFSFIATVTPKVAGKPAKREV